MHLSDPDKPKLRTCSQQQKQPAGRLCDNALRCLSIFLPASRLPEPLRSTAHPPPRLPFLRDYIKDKYDAAAAAGRAEQFVVTEGMIAEFKAVHSAQAKRNHAHGA